MCQTIRVSSLPNTCAEIRAFSHLLSIESVPNSRDRRAFLPLRIHPMCTHIRVCLCDDRSVWFVPNSCIPSANRSVRCRNRNCRIARDERLLPPNRRPHFLCTLIYTFAPLKCNAAVQFDLRKFNLKLEIFFYLI